MWYDVDKYELEGDVETMYAKKRFQFSGNVIERSVVPCIVRFGLYVAIGRCIVRI